MRADDFFFFLCLCLHTAVLENKFKHKKKKKTRIIFRFINENIFPTDVFVPPRVPVGCISFLISREYAAECDDFAFGFEN